MDQKIISEIYNDLKKHFISDVYPVSFSPNVQGCSVLLEEGTMRVIGAGKNAITLSSQMSINTQGRTHFRSRKLTNNFNLTIDCDKVWLIKFDSESKWVKDYNFRDEDEVRKFIFLNQKFLLADRINTVCMNSFVKTPYEVYLNMSTMNEIQNINFNKVKSDPLNEYPIVSSYSRIYGIDLQEAISKLELSLKCETTQLSEFEYLRLKFTKLASEQEKIEDLKNLLQQFDDEFIGYSRVVNHD
jgi:hypothetical protein